MPRIREQSSPEPEPTEPEAVRLLRRLLASEAVAEESPFSAVYLVRRRGRFYLTMYPARGAPFTAAGASLEAALLDAVRRAEE